LPDALVITGPTASGKSALAYALADRFDLEVITVDSAQVYTDMDIGTAKPNAAQRALVPHHLLDIRAPTEPYTAFDFCQDARHAIAAVQASGRVPVLVGGTMLYLKALRDGIANLPEANPVVRLEILEAAQAKGWPWLHEELRRIDPQAALRIKPTDRQRLQRALEVERLTGQTLTALQAQGQLGIGANLTEVAIMPESRAQLHHKIEVRFDEMLNQGLVTEVERLREKYELHDALPAMKAVGYRQVWQYLEGDLGFDEMREKGIIATRQLAKRQFTWLRSFEAVKKISTPSLDALLKIDAVANILIKA